MNNKGQTTVLFSLMISALLLFTLTALEVGRIYMGRVKVRAVVHSTCSNLMADYNSELFERYHLLFMDPTYGTGSEAAAEEKIEDYLESSLNGEDPSGIYVFTLEEIALADPDYILDQDMELLKKQMTDYEKTEGIVHRAQKLGDRLKNQKSDVEGAFRETEINGVEFPKTEKEDSNKSTEKETAGEEKEPAQGVTDPRDTLSDILKNGLLSFLLPGDSTISKEAYDFKDSPSKQYKEQEHTKRDASFQDILSLKGLLKEAAKEDEYSGLAEHAAFVDYVASLFSNEAAQREDSVLKCEVEYILKGKDNDYDNLQAVVEELTWLRMPVNYAYLLTDTQKKSEALTLAATICTATGTEALIEVVKYLLLGCWSYGETIYEMRLLLSGEKIPYIKTKETWYTDLQTLSGSGQTSGVENGMAYEDYLMLLLAKKGEKERNLCYARMLDVIEKNLQREDADFQIADCVGSMTVQGRIHINPLFVRNRGQEIYGYSFEETFSY